MVSIASLWLPILLSAVAVFVVSSLIHMVLPYHKSDYKKLPSEDGVMDALRKFDLAPGDYFFPLAGGSREMKDSAFQEKFAKGPAGSMTVLPKGPWSMGSTLALWFLYCVVIGTTAAYIAGRALPAGAHYRAVFRFAGATAFYGYALALWQNTIWYKKSWMTTLKSTFDGLFYGLLTGGVFGWLWPR
jgi:hypothetical protein